MRMDISGDWNRGYGFAATAKSPSVVTTQNGVKDAEKQLGRKAASLILAKFFLQNLV